MMWMRFYNDNTWHFQKLGTWSTGWRRRLENITIKWEQGVLTILSSSPLWMLNRRKRSRSSFKTSFWTWKCGSQVLAPASTQNWPNKTLIFQQILWTNRSFKMWGISARFSWSLASFNSRTTLSRKEKSTNISCLAISLRLFEYWPTSPTMKRPS